MKILPYRENAIRENVRNILSVNPYVSGRRLQEMVRNNTGYPVGDKYLTKIVGKVQRETVISSDRLKRNERLAEARARHRAHLNYLQRIAYWKHEYRQDFGIERPKARDQLAAIRLMSQIDIAFMKAEMAVGAFEPYGSFSIELSEERVSRTVRIQGNGERELS
ncbi:MAG: hypothetical protein V4644_01550 [Patescibacteria group bacterium]